MGGMSVCTKERCPIQWDKISDDCNVRECLYRTEAYKPTIACADNYDELCPSWYQCSACKFPIDKGDRYCRYCGRAVKWND